MINLLKLSSEKEDSSPNTWIWISGKGFRNKINEILREIIEKKNIKKTEIIEKFDQIVEFAGIEQFIDTPVKYYSSGMYVRLAFSVAAHLEPDILLVDEVLAVGDTEFQKKCLGKMDEITKKEGRTILFVSHNLNAIRQLCTRVVLLESGKIKKIGSTDQIVEEYLNNTQYNKENTHQWKNEEMPGDKSTKIKMIRLSSENGDTRSAFSNTENIIIEVEYYLYEKIYNFMIGYSLFSAQGSYIFYSSNTDTKGNTVQTREPGHYLDHCVIPGKLLNQADYYIQLSGGIFGEKIIFKNLPKLYFTIHQSDELISIHYEKRNGIIHK